MKKGFIVVANSGVAKIYLFSPNNPHLFYFKKLEHIESKYRNKELVSSKAGCYKTQSSQNSSYEKKDHHFLEKVRFAKYLRKYLNNNIRKGNCESIILVSSDAFHGVLNKALDKEVRSKIIKDIMKDYTEYNIKDLERKLLGFINKAKFQMGNIK